MEKNKDNLPKKFNEIKNEFGHLTNDNNKKQLKKNKSFSNYINRPNLIKNKIKLNIDRTELNKQLEQIGNDELIFSNDKLITNVKIESYENMDIKSSIFSEENDRSFIKKNKKKINSTSINFKEINRKKIRVTTKKLSTTSNSNTNNNTFELNCNKMPYIHNNKKQNNLNKNKNICIKNVNQFVNRPNDNRENLNREILMTPTSIKSAIEIKNKKIFKNNDFHMGQCNYLNINNNENTSLASTSRIDISRLGLRGRSMPQKKANKNQSNLHLPNKSIIKNQDKVVIELQRLFGEKIQLTEDIYENMTDFDKKNCINFLLEVIKHLSNIYKLNKSKTDGYKQINEIKEQQIKNCKNEIKELKKEIVKLNKFIKTNMQLIKKLSQNVENLKLQLEKEKAKNKAMQKTRRSTSKVSNPLMNEKFKNEVSVNKRRYKSQDFEKKINGLVHIKKIDNNIAFRKTNNLNNNKNQIKKKIIDKNEVNYVNNIVWKNNEEKKNDISSDSLIKIQNVENNNNNVNTNLNDEINNKNNNNINNNNLNEENINKNKVDNIL